ncbi:unnamed protein product [Eruca vesicaria subsp. sativa]|uniref:UBX domain-containing protein n=1 Tax=Eruca vesicaria subsp. sativa TaxID=29727 RepID=A0ABC8JMN5_ERUVS|nr:unnamed protein product [Eruca vesicaria subsp. sativa]
MAKRSFAMLESQTLVENSSPFIDTKRRKHCPDASAASESTTTTTTYLFLTAFVGYPELSEPYSDLDQRVLCRICVRLPDGRRVQRSFLKCESVQLLWSFCYSQIDQSERNKPFKLFQAVPGYYKNLYYGSDTSFEQPGLANSLISLTWV